MACSGAHCTNHGTGTSTCSGHRAGCSTNRTLSTVASGRGTILKESHIDHLRGQIRAEVSRWNSHRWYNVPLYESNGRSVGTSVSDNDMLYNLDRMIHGIMGGGINIWSSYTDRGDQVIHSYYQTLVNEYNVARRNCICNSDCACNNVCACHNDCGCNYSDRRLKKEIVYC